MRVKVKLTEEWGGWSMGMVIDSKKLLMQGDEWKEGSRVFLIGWQGRRGGRTFLSETGKPCSTFFRASALKSRDSDIFPVASIHFDYRHFQLFYSLLIKTGGEEDVRGFARIHCSCILPIIYIYIYKNIEKEEEDWKHTFFSLLPLLFAR